MIVAVNQPKNKDEYDCKKDEVKLVTYIYDKSTGQFNGLKLQLAYIVLRGYKKEPFFLYRVNENKKSVLYSVSKERVPNALASTCFKKHFREVTEERRHCEKSSSLFFYLSSVTDRKDFFRQLAETGNANLIRNADCLLASNKDGKDNSVIAWVGPNKQRNDTTKFKLTY